MLRKVTRSALLAATLCVVWQATSGDAQAIHGNNEPIVCRPYAYGTPDLFYNFYVPPNCGGMGAELYIAPYPVPPLVGHTYYTYQPFMPHHYLYHHKRSYHRYYDEGRGMTRAHVKWTHPPVKTTASAIYQHFRIPR